MNTSLRTASVCSIFSGVFEQRFFSQSLLPFSRLLFSFLIFCTSVPLSAQVIWLENFSGANQGWSTDFTDCDGLTNGFYGVRNNRFEVQGMEGRPCCGTPLPPLQVPGGNYNEWITNPINIAGRCQVSISVNYGSNGASFECNAGGPHTGVPCSTLPAGILIGHDQIVFEYRIDGGPWIQFRYHCGGGGGTATANNLSGNTIEIRILPANKDEAEMYWFDNVTVSATPPPTATQPANLTVCAGQIVNVTLTGSTTTTFPWTNNNTAIGLGGSGPGNVVSFTAANVTTTQMSTITVTPTRGTCVGTPITFDVTVNPRPIADDPMDLTLCGGSMGAIPVTGTSGATFNWTNANGATGVPTTGSGDINFTASNVTTQQVSNIIITPSLNGCNGIPQTVVVTVRPNPTVTVPANPTRCSGQSVTVNFGGTAGATLNWTNDNTNIGLGGSGSGNISFTGATPSNTTETATITVTPTLGTCIGQPQTLTITVNPTPTMDLPAPVTVCGGEPLNILFNSAFSGVTFNWLNSNSQTGIPSSGNGDIAATAANVSAPQSGTITVTPNLSGCIGPAQTVMVLVNPTPVVNNINDVTRCTGQNISVPITGTTGATMSWTNDNTAIGLGGSGTGNINFAGQTPGGVQQVATITVTPTFGVCPGMPRTFMITVNPVPTVDPVANITVCGGDAILANFTGTSSSATFNWTNTNTQTGIPSSGSGDINATAATGTTVRTGTITVTPTENGCPGTPRTFQVTVNPTPLVNPINNLTRCAGQNVSVNITGTAGMTVNWTNDNTAIGLGASGTSNSLNFTGTAPNGATETANITVTPSFGNCPGQPVNFTITVNPTPIMNAPAPVTVCGGEPINIPFSSTFSGVTFNWTNNNGQTGIPGSGSGDIGATANNVTNPVTSTITITPNIAGCNGPARTVTALVNPTPVVNNINDVTRCTGQNIAVSITGTAGATLTWTNDNTGIGLGASGVGNINFTGQTPGGVPQIAMITVTPTFAGCMGQPRTFMITVNPVPVLNPIPNLTVCGGSPIDVQFFGNSPGATYNWVNSNSQTGIPSNGSGDINATAATVTTVRTGTITVTPTENGCPGIPRTFQVTVNPTPLVNPINNLTRCAGQNVSVNITGTAGMTVNWTNDNTAIGLGASGTSNSLNFTGTAPNGATETANITVTPSFGNCPGQPVNFSITVNPTPTMLPPAPVTVCGGEPINIPFSSTFPGVTFNWTNNNGQTGIPGSGSGDIGATANNVTNPVTSTITITPNIAGCNGPTRTVTALVNPTPVVNNIGDVTRCTGQNISVSVTGTSGATLTWTNDNTGIGLGASGVGNINFTGQTPGGVPQIAMITVTPTFAGCVGQPRTFLIMVNPVPVLNPIPNLTVCGGGPIDVQFFGNSPGATYNWVNSNSQTGIPSNGSGDINATAATLSLVRTSTITVTPVENGCSGTPRTFTVTVQPVATIAPINDLSRCVGQNIAITLTGTPGAVMQWANDNTAIGLGASGAGNLNFTGQAAGGITQTGMITVTPTVGNCPGVPVTFNITVNPIPAVTAPLNQTVCAGEPIDIQFFGSPGATFNWTNSSNQTGIPLTGNGDIMVNANNVTVPRTSTIIVIPTENGCTGAPRTFTVTVNPGPVVNQLPNVTRCAGQNVAISLGNIPGATLNWENSNPAIGLIPAGSGSNISFIAQAPAGVAEFAVVSVTATANGCTGPTRTFDIFINPPPAMNPPANLTVCGGTVISIPFSPNTASFTWSNNNTATGITAGNSGSTLTATAANVTIAGTSVITVFPSENGCQGPSVTFSVTVQPIPTINVLANINRCVGESVSVAFSGTAGAAFNWTNSNPNIGLAATGTGNALNFTAAAPGGPQTATITVTPRLGNCSGPARTFTVQVAAAPSVNPVPDLNICAGTPIAAVFSGNVTGTVFNWTNNNAATGLNVSGTGNISDTSALVTTTQTGIITVTPVASGCAGTPTAFNLTVRGASVVDSVPNYAVCGGLPVAINFTGNSPVFNWVNNNTSTGIPASGTGNISFAAINNPGTSVITVTPSGTCPGPARTFTFSVVSAPVADNPGAKNVCVGSVLNVPVTGTAATTFNWTNSNTAIGLPGAGAGNLNFTALAAGQNAIVTVTPVLGACTGAPVTFDIAVRALPVATISGPAALCIGSSATLTASGGNSYNWNAGSTAAGLTVTPAATTTYSVTVANNFGCTATRQQTVRVNLPSTVNFSRTSCNPADTGVSVRILKNFANCDSTVTTVTRYLRSDTTRFSKTSCSLNLTGIVTQRLTNRSGCDSLIITVTTFDPAGRDTTYATRNTCNPGLAGTSQQLFKNKSGCDSLAITTTLLLPFDTTRLNRVSCNPTQAGIQTQRLTNRNGCDSLVITTVIFNPSGRDTTRLSRITCNPLLAGTTQRSFINSLNCDSLVIMTTTVRLLDTIRLSKITCVPAQAGISTRKLLTNGGCDSIILINTIFDASGRDTTQLSARTCDPTLAGVTSRLLQNSGGCDSLVITTTALLAKDTTRLTKRTCNPTLLGVVNRLLQNRNGCDSLVVTSTVFDPFGRDTTQLSARTCDPALAGVTSRLLQNRGGCDSLVVTTTALLAKDTTRLTKRTCNPNFTGTATRLLQNRNGCDSLIITNTLFDPLGKDTTQLSARTCDPALAGITSRLLKNSGGCDSLVITVTALLVKDTTRLTKRTCNPTLLGVVNRLLQNRNGCDSLVVTSTVFDPFGRDTTQLSARTCDSALAGITSRLLQNRDGCDSLVVTTTALLVKDTTRLTKRTCNPTLLGVVNRLLQNRNGCDSLVVTSTVFDPFGRDTTQLSARTCDPALAGVTSRLLQNRGGCDSLVVTTTALLAKDTTRLTKRTCNPTLLGVVNRLLQNRNGCDSLVVTSTVFDPFGRDTTQLSARTCDPALAGVTSRLLQNRGGCDSLVVTTTALLAKDTTRLTKRTCNPTLLGVASRLLKNRNGCDSLVVTSTVLDPFGRDTTYLPFETCNPAQTGTVSQLLTNRAGCDSLVLTITRLNLAPCAFKAGIVGGVTSCPGVSDGSATLVMSKGQPPFNYRWSGLAGTGGTGEITNLNSPAILNNLAPGNYKVTITKPNTPLDTVINFTVTAPTPISIQALPVLTAAPYAIKCFGQTNGIATANVAGGNPPFSFVWSNGATSTSLTGVGAGTYTLTVTDKNGCTTRASATLTAPPRLKMTLNVAPPACGDTRADATLSLSGGAGQFAVTVNSQPRPVNNIALSGGQNLIVATDKNGCTIDTSLRIVLPPVPTLSLPKDTTVLLGETLTLEAKTNILAWDTLIWRALPDPKCPGCLKQTWRPARDQRFEVILLDTLGCRAAATVVVYVKRDINIFVPNIFSPNGDGQHDIFKIGVSKNLEDASLDELRIYDRWGNQVYGWKEPIPIALWPGWDGRFGEGALVQPAVFVYYMKIRLPSGETFERSGDVTVLR